MSSYNDQINKRAEEIKRQHADPKEPTMEQKIEKIKEKYNNMGKKDKTPPKKILEKAKSWKVAGEVPSSPLAKKQGVPAGVDPGKHERCVVAVKKEGSADNPWAVCSAMLKKAATCLTKDNAPHPAGSPEDVAHDVIEEGKPLPKAMGELSAPEALKAMLGHLRGSKEQGWERSAENQKAGAGN
jgi:hypothetical protein